MINFNASKLEWKFAAKIAGRAVAYGDRHQLPLDYCQIEMDIISCHVNGCPLDLERLLAAEESEFVHDVLGIRRHIDRKTGELGDCFLPRFAESEQQYAADATI